MTEDPTSPTGTKSTRKPAGDPAMPIDAATMSSDSGPITPDTAASSGVTHFSDTVENKPVGSGLSASAPGSSAEQKQRIRDKAVATAEKLKSEVGNTAHSLGEGTRARVWGQAERQQGKLDQFTHKLHGSGSSLVGRLEQFIRDQPGIVLAGAFVSGVLIVRFIRSSRRREDPTDYRIPGFSHENYASSSIPAGFN